MSDYLPPVVARLTMDMGEFTAGIAKAKALMKGLSGDLNIRTDGLDRAVAKVEALKNSLNGMNANIRVSTDGMGAFAAKSALVNRTGRTTFRPYILGLRLAGNALHWAISLATEFLAVAIPATVALAAGLAVMAPAAISTAQHMQSLAIATQATFHMFGQTAGSVLGLSGALTQAQNAARPAVFSMLGSALITAKEGAGGFAAAGLQVTQMLQTFAAKVAVDFGPGGALGGGHLLKTMTSDLQGFGQVLGNILHIISNVGNAAPGLAEILLKGLAGLTGFLSHLSGAAPLLITVGMGFEELVRWGGLAASILARVGRGFGALLKLAGLAEAASRVNAFSKALQMLGKTGLGKFQIAGIAALAIGLGILIDKVVTARTELQQLGDSMQRAVLKAPNTQAMGVALNNIAQLNSKIAQIKANQAAASKSTDMWGNSQIRASVIAKNGIDQVNAAMRQQETDARNIAQGGQLIARTYGTTLVGALALADEANVKLAKGITGTSQAAMIGRMQIASLVQGYQAMGQSSGEVGKDMTALAIQSGLAATGVSKLNSAWDDFTSNLTGGTTALASLGQDLTGLVSGTTKISNVLGKAGSLTLGVKQFADSLKSFSGAGATAWQNFGQAVSKGQALLDWMRTAGAEGALTAKQFTQAGLDMASAFVPLASSSKAAQAQLLGLVQQVDPTIQTFGQLKAAIRQNHASFGGLGSIVTGATQKMANMESVARKLGTVLNSALISALQAAQVRASGAGAAMQRYAQDLMNGNRAAARSDYRALLNDLERLGLNARQAAALIRSVTQNLNSLNGRTANAYVVTHMITTGQPVPGITQGIPIGVRRGFAKGTPSATPGWAWVGEAGPELVKMRGGETVLPHNVSTGYAGGAGYGGDIHVHVTLDGREITSAVSTRAVQTQRRTGHNGLSKRTR